MENEALERLKTGIVDDLIEAIKLFAEGAINSPKALSRLAALHRLSLMAADSESGPELAKMATQIEALNDLQEENLKQILAGFTEQLSAILAGLKESPCSK